MMKHWIRKLATGITVVIFFFYVVALLANIGDDIPVEPQDMNTARHQTVAIFGATGTIGDGLLKAAMNDPTVGKILVVTRRPSARIEEGGESGKVEMIIHKDYLNYGPILDAVADADAVFWAIGLSAVGLDEETYREIHVDFPVQFVAQWLDASQSDSPSFHYVSGSGAKSESRMMWARVKAEAEADLEQLAQDANLRVVSYRPSFILPTETEAHLGHRILYAIFAPIKSAVAAEAIGQAMLETSARGQQYGNGAILENREVVELSAAYGDRVR